MESCGSHPRQKSLGDEQEHHTQLMEMQWGISWLPRVGTALSSECSFTRQLPAHAAFRPPAAPQVKQGAAVQMKEPFEFEVTCHLVQLPAMTPTAPSGSQSPVQPDLGHLQVWSTHHLFGQPMLVPWSLTSLTPCTQKPAAMGTKSHTRAWRVARRQDCTCHSCLCFWLRKNSTWTKHPQGINLHDAQNRTFSPSRHSLLPYSLPYIQKYRTCIFNKNTDIDF